MTGIEPGMSDREADALLYILTGLAEMEQPQRDEGEGDYWSPEPMSQASSEFMSRQAGTGAGVTRR